MSLTPAIAPRRYPFPLAPRDIGIAPIVLFEGGLDPARAPRDPDLREHALSVISAAGVGPSDIAGHLGQVRVKVFPRAYRLEEKLSWLAARNAAVKLHAAPRRHRRSQGVGNCLGIEPPTLQDENYAVVRRAFGRLELFPWPSQLRNRARDEGPRESGI